MAAPRLLQTLGLRPYIGHTFSRHSSSTSNPNVKNNFLNFMNRYFSDIEVLLNWAVRWKYWRLRNKNEQLGYTEALYGKSAAATYYALSMKGGVRFLGHQEWIRPDHRGRFTMDFLKYKEMPVECVDLSGSEVNYSGLQNIMELQEVRYLNLSRCPHIDDWCLNRLYVFCRSLEVLVLAGCPQVSERGLATLHHLQNLKYLDISDLPNVANKGLTRILLEEVLPGCEITGMEYTDGLQQEEISAQSEVS